jgi:putative nucleotidyltransferase with HDIG domain
MRHTSFIGIVPFLVLVLVLLPAPASAQADTVTQTVGTTTTAPAPVTLDTGSPVTKTEPAQANAATVQDAGQPGEPALPAAAAPLSSTTTLTSAVQITAQDPLAILALLKEPPLIPGGLPTYWQALLWALLGGAVGGLVYELLRLQGNIELMEVLGGAIAKRDSDTNIHNYRVSIYAVRLAEAAGLDAAAIRNLIAGAFLHDVGKIGISDNILLKPAKLSEAEFAVMKTHVTLGVDILEKSNWLKTARDVVEFHHEKFDGGGYMRGLKGEAIPVNARIFAIVDVFDALTSQRPYKKALPFDAAMAILRRDGGSHFDPGLLGVFERIAEPLYLDVSAAADAVVEEKLQALISDYFFSSRRA